MTIGSLRSQEFLFVQKLQFTTILTTMISSEKRDELQLLNEFFCDLQAATKPLAILGYLLSSVIIVILTSVITYTVLSCFLQRAAGYKMVAVSSHAWNWIANSGLYLTGYLRLFRFDNVQYCLLLYFSSLGSGLITQESRRSSGELISRL